MQLTARHYDIDSSDPTVLMHETDCQELGVREGDRVRVSGPKGATAIVSMSDTLLEAGVVMIPVALLEACGVRDGECVDVIASPAPDSVRSIRRKMDGLKLTEEEITGIVDDVMEGRLSKIEISAWLTALHINSMDLEETAAYIRAMAATGGSIRFDRPQVLDFHSFGGVPGNKITPIVVSIVAAAGNLIPKLSSRAISSACGSADFIETFCRIDLDDDEVRRITEEVGGVFSWTGATDLSPAGDVFIRTQRPLGIDPRPQMLASILGKKVAAGATDLLMDIPMGRETKVGTLEEARSYARDLMELGDILGMRIECAVTYADQPLGEAVGPILEARECMQVLEGVPGHEEVAEKACICAGILLEMTGTMNGHDAAKRILESGDARRKFLEIVAAQDGRPDISSGDMVPGRFSEDVVATRSGFVRGMSNKAVVAVAKAAGAPSDKGAGVILRRKRGNRVAEGDVLMTVYADNADKLAHAVAKAADRSPFDVDGMVLGRISPSAETFTDGGRRSEP